MSVDLDAVWARYEKALEARPAKGPWTGENASALADSCADVPGLVKEIEGLKVQLEGLGMVRMSLNGLRNECGRRAEANGWHQRWENLQAEGYREDRVDHLVAKTALIGNEVAEAIEELREGRGPDEVYYTINGVRVFPVTDGSGASWTTDPRGTDNGTTWTGIQAKPEGYPTELADVIIRALDMAAMLNIDINAIVWQKLVYNATRGQMHGGKRI